MIKAKTLQPAFEEKKKVMRRKKKVRKEKKNLSRLSGNFN